MGGSFYVTREELRSYVLEREEGVKQCQEYLMSLIYSAATTASQIATKGSFSPEETIEAHQFSIDIYKRLFSDGNVGFYANYISHHYRRIALLYAELGDAKHTLDALKENCCYSVTEATLRDMNYTAPMINRVQHKQADTTKNYTGNCCNISLKTLEDKRFDFVRDTEAFQKMVAELKRYAE